MTRAEFQQALQRCLSRARGTIDVNAGELHREVGGYPGPGHRMPLACSVMRTAMCDGDQIVAAPPKGNGASLTIRYRR